MKDGTSDQKMKELNEAYEILSNSEKRNIYDKYGRDAAKW
ncbi:DnaJ domain-containing protein [Mycoplasmopsis cynos]|nr:DnaJ domain-containing protein [Mycoplasmopsis cynos]WAM04081.1 DnaJ domain-containing protein [Mycoplasmopsis cynos]